MAKAPLVSVILPCYNQAEFLPDAIKSLLDQSYSNWEGIIVDDGSNDGTEGIAKAWLEKDNRLKYVKKANGGLASARNMGLEKAGGEYIQFLDSDDYLESHKLECSVHAIGAHHEGTTPIAISNFVLLEEKSKIVKPPYCNLEGDLFNFEKVLYQWDETFTIPIHCGFFDKRLFRQFRFPEKLRAREDWIMWLVLLKVEPKIVFIDKPLAVYRKHEKSMTMSANIFEEHKLSIDFLKKNVLSDKEYEKLLEVLFMRFYRISLKFKAELFELQKSRLFTLYTFLKRAEKKVRAQFNSF